MSGNYTQDDDASNTDDETLVTRRGALRAGATAAAVAATAGVGTAADAESLDHSSDFVQDPFITANIVVSRHKPDFEPLDYIDDDGSVRSLAEHGVRLAVNRDEETPHNPVTITPTKIDSEEYTAYPRDLTYDDDSDSSTDEVAVSWTDATHWTESVTDSDGSVTTTLSEGDASLTLGASGVGSSDSATWTLDLSSIGSTDGTLTEGVERTWLQGLLDVDTLQSGSEVRLEAVDSTGSVVSISADPDGDDSTAGVATTTTGSSLAWQQRLGDLMSAQSSTLDDVEQIRVVVDGADAQITLHALNCERSTEWTWGTYETTDSDGEVVEETWSSPSGSISLMSLESLPDVWLSAEIHDVEYDAEVAAARLPDEQVHVASRDAPESYEYRKILEVAYEIEIPTAYALSTSVGKLRDVVSMPGSRYLTAEVATGVSDVEDLEDLDSISWTDRSGTYGSGIDSEVDLLTSPSTSRTVVHHEISLSQSELDDATDGGGMAVVGAAGGGGSTDGTLAGMLAGVAAGITGLLMYVRRQAGGLL